MTGRRCTPKAALEIIILFIDFEEIDLLQYRGVWESCTILHSLFWYEMIYHYLYFKNSEFYPDITEGLPNIRNLTEKNEFSRALRNSFLFTKFTNSNANFLQCTYADIAMNLDQPLPSKIYSSMLKFASVEELNKIDIQTSDTMHDDNETFFFITGVFNIIFSVIIDRKTVNLFVFKRRLWWCSFFDSKTWANARKRGVQEFKIKDNTSFFPSLPLNQSIISKLCPESRKNDLIFHVTSDFKNIIKNKIQYYRSNTISKLDLKLSLETISYSLNKRTEIPIRGAPTKPLTPDDCTIPPNTCAENKRIRKKKFAKIDHKLRVWGKQIATFVGKLTEGCKKLLITMKIGIPKANSHVKGEFFNGKLVSDLSVSTKGTTSTLLQHKTPQEILIQKEKTSRSLTSIKLELCNANKSEKYRSLAKYIRNVRKTITDSLFLIKAKEKRKTKAPVKKTKKGKVIRDQCQFGIIRNPIAISDEYLTPKDNILSFLNDHFEYIFHANKRKTEMNLHFDNLCELRIYNENNNVRIEVKSIKLIIGDESYTLDSKKKFLLSYLRELITNNALNLKSLCPFIYQNKGTSFWENKHNFGMGYSHLIDEFEKNHVIKTITSLKSDVLKLLTDYKYDDNSFNVINYAKEIKLDVVYKVMYLEDMAEILDKFKCKIHAFSTRENKDRCVGYLTTPLSDDTSLTTKPDLVDFKYCVGKRLQFDILRKHPGTEMYNGVIPKLFPAYDKPQSLAIHKNGASVLLELLHNFRPKEFVFRKFFMNHFVPFCISNSSFRDDEKYVTKYIDFWIACESFDLVVKGSIRVEAYTGKIIFPKNELFYFNQTVNLRFFNSLSDYGHQINDLLGKYIENIAIESTRNLCLLLHGQLIGLFGRIFGNQKILYQKEYYNLETFLLLYENCDFIDSGQDSISCHFLLYFAHYRDAEEVKLVSQTVRNGKGKTQDIGACETAHKFHKRRLYTQDSISPNARGYKLRDIKTGKLETLSLSMQSKVSQVFLYGKIKLQEECNFGVVSPEFSSKNINLPNKEYTCAHQSDMDVIMQDPHVEQNDPISKDNDIRMQDSTTAETTTQEEQIEAENMWKTTLEKYTNLPVRPKPQDPHYFEWEQFRSLFNVNCKKLKKLVLSNPYYIDFSSGISKFHVDFKNRISIQSFPPEVVEVLKLVQHKMVNFEFQQIYLESPTVDGSETGIGKTFASAFVHLTKLFNSHVRVIFLVSKTPILEQWVTEYEKMCGIDYFAVPMPNFIRFYAQGDKLSKLKVGLTKGRTIFLCTFESLGNFFAEPQSPLITLLSRYKYDILIDECQYLKTKASKYMKGIIPLRKNCKNLKLMSATPITGTKEQAKCIYDVMNGEISQQRDFSFSKLKEYILPKMIREKKTLEIPLYYVVVMLKPNSSLEKALTEYNSFKDITDSKMNNDKWVSSSASHELLDITCHSIDFIQTNYRNTKEWVQRFQPILCEKNINSQYKIYQDYDLQMNPKFLFGIMVATHSLKKGYWIILIVSSHKFQEYIVNGFKSKSSSLLQFRILKDRVVFINGNMLNPERLEKIAIFEDSPHPMVLVTTVRIFAAGLNLQKRANIIVKLSLFKDTTASTQAPGRCHRDGQPNPFVLFFDVMFENSLEHSHLKLLGSDRLSKIYDVCDNINLPQHEINSKLQNSNDLDDIEQSLKTNPDFPKIFQVLFDQNIRNNISRAFYFDKEILGRNLRDIPPLETTGDDHQ